MGRNDHFPSVLRGATDPGDGTRSIKQTLAFVRFKVVSPDSSQLFFFHANPNQWGDRFKRHGMGRFDHRQGINQASFKGRRVRHPSQVIVWLLHASVTTAKDLL